MNSSNLTTTPFAYLTPTLTTLITSSTTFSISIVGILANIFLIFILSIDPQLQSPCFNLILGTSVGSLIMSLGQAFMAVGKLGLWPYKNQSRFACQLMTGLVFKSLAIPFASQATFLICVDRLFCTIFPVRYYKRGRNCAIAGLLVCLAYGMAQLVFLLVGAGPLGELLVSCADSQAVSGPLFYTVYHNMNFFFFALCVLGYVIMMIFINRSRAVDIAHHLPPTQRLQFIRQYKSILPAVKFLIACYVVLGIAPELLYSLSSQVTYGSYEIMIIAELLKALSSLVEVVALSSRCHQFRQSCRRLWKKNQVAMVNVMGGGQKNRRDTVCSNLNMRA